LGKLTISQQVGYSSPLRQEANLSIVFNAIRAIWLQPAARHSVGMKTSKKCLLASLYTIHFEAVSQIEVLAQVAPKTAGLCQNCVRILERKMPASN